MYERWGKRTLDFALGALLLLAALPALALATAAVRLSLGAPVLFVQDRAGRGGVPFAVWKLRTMREGPGDDALRLTHLGRALRATALDELPQLLQVLRGEMSLVGPRPLPPHYTPLYSARQAMRLRVRPGLCGLAQAQGRNAVPWEERLEWDARYATTPPTLAADLRIIFRCAVLLLRGRGASAPGHATMPPFRG
jgi:lipopolysaccharide/colanic/teichoic acid biosynthesis glycosyltransferase